MLNWFKKNTPVWLPTSGFAITGILAIVRFSPPSRWSMPDWSVVAFVFFSGWLFCQALHSLWFHERSVIKRWIERRKFRAVVEPYYQDEAEPGIHLISLQLLIVAPESIDTKDIEIHYWLGGPNNQTVDSRVDKLPSLTRGKLHNSVLAGFIVNMSNKTIECVSDDGKNNIMIDSNTVYEACFTISAQKINPKTITRKVTFEFDLSRFISVD
ncbi:hypothetical protein [Hyphococcus lacteus]|uniref:SMODS-associating 2TM beta-strand rich effector domain-containing protein n=1 Tax=Hyphococcus lacteus TaxID=3143536 RepID=A0ABV3Z4P4_9PROT